MQNQYLNDHQGTTPAEVAKMPAAQIISAEWQSFFTADWSGGVLVTPQNVAMAIFKHYWMREIGLETVALWKHWLDVKVTEIVPKYLDYEKQIVKAGDVFENVGLTETLTRQFDRITNDTKTGSSNQYMESDVDSSSHGTNVRTEERTLNSKDLYSDTPQNGLTDVEQGNYLTSADVKADVQEGTQSDTMSQTAESSTSGHMAETKNETVDGNMNDTETRNTGRSGFQGDKVETLGKYREMYWNLMESIVVEVAPLFMGLL